MKWRVETTTATILCILPYSFDTKKEKKRAYLQKNLEMENSYGNSQILCVQCMPFFFVYDTLLHERERWRAQVYVLKQKNTSTQSTASKKTEMQPAHRVTMPMAAFMRGATTIKHTKTLLFFNGWLFRCNTHIASIPGTCRYCSWRILLRQIFIILSGNAILLKWKTHRLQMNGCPCKGKRQSEKRDPNDTSHRSEVKKVKYENGTESLTTLKW